MKMPRFSKRVLAVLGITLIIALSTTCSAFESTENSLASNNNEEKYLTKTNEIGAIPVISLSAPARQLKAAKSSKKSVGKSKKGKSKKATKKSKSKKSKSKKAATKKGGKSKKATKKGGKSKKATKKGGKSKKATKKGGKSKKATKKGGKSKKGATKKSKSKSKKGATKKGGRKSTKKGGKKSTRKGGKSTKKGGKTKSRKGGKKSTKRGKKSTKGGKSGKGRKTRSKKQSSNPFNRMSGWFKASKKTEPVKVEAKTTVVRTVKSKARDGKSEKKVEKEVTSMPEENVDLLGSVRTRGQEEAEPFKVYVTNEHVQDGDKDVFVETKTESHHHLVEQPQREETVFTFYEEDETVREVEGLTYSKEAKLVAMLIESAAENASPILRQSLESIRVLKYSKSSRKDCPNVVTTTGWCSATCGSGERYKFKLWWDEATETCKKETLVQDCVVVSGCENPDDKWSILQVSRPDYLPGQAYLELAGLLPEEGEWKKDITTDGYVFYSFRTKLSGRYCPFSGVPMEDDECGIAYRYYYTQFLDRTGDAIVARGGFDRVPDIVSCETADKQQQLTQRQQRDLLNHFLEEYAEETDEAGPIINSLRELQIIEYQANELHPMCPSIATNQSSCSSNGCGHGRKYSLTSRYSPITEVCQTLRQEPCLLVSGCENPSTKWQLLEVEKPERVPENVFLYLGEMIPSESEWEKVRTKKGNILRVGFGFSTPWSQRFSPNGEPMGEDQCGPAQRWRYVREYSEADDAILQDFVVADASIPCTEGEYADYQQPTVTKTIYEIHSTEPASVVEEHIPTTATTLEAVVEEIMPQESAEESAEEMSTEN